MITFDPTKTSTAVGFFNAQSYGLVQGEYQQDPVDYYAIHQGFVDPGEANPLWGGIAITEKLVSDTGTNRGNALSRATQTTITGFTVGSHMHNGIIVPGSNTAPVVAAGMSAQFARLGSGVILAVQADPALVSLNTGSIAQQVSWDVTNQKLVAFSVNALNVKVLSVVATGCQIVNFSGGAATWVNGACALIQL